MCIISTALSAFSKVAFPEMFLSENKVFVYTSTRPYNFLDAANITHDHVEQEFIAS